MGRPRKIEGDLRKMKTFSLGAAEIEAIQELSRIRGEPQSVVAGKLFVRELTRQSRRYSH